MESFVASHYKDTDTWYVGLQILISRTYSLTCCHMVFFFRLWALNQGCLCCFACGSLPGLRWSRFGSIVGEGFRLLFQFSESREQQPASSKLIRNSCQTNVSFELDNSLSDMFPQVLTLNFIRCTWICLSSSWVPYIPTRVPCNIPQPRLPQQLNS